MNEAGFFLMVIAVCECARLAIDIQNRKIQSNYDQELFRMKLECSEHQKVFHRNLQIVQEENSRLLRHLDSKEKEKC